MSRHILEELCAKADVLARQAVKYPNTIVEYDCTRALLHYCDHAPADVSRTVFDYYLDKIEEYRKTD